MAYTTINKSTDYFNTKLYTGTGSSNAITGVGFAPDWVWLKRRDTSGNNYVFDTVRGATQRLITNDPASDAVDNASLTAFGSDGFTVNTETDLNANSGTFASWNWLANGAGSANTDGSISSTVSANTTNGFSIVSYTGNGSAGATVGHGLGSTPKMIIVKKRNGTASWKVYHASVGATASCPLNTNGIFDVEIYPWNNTEPTSSVFSLGTTGETNGSGANIIAYCFSDVQGFSKMGSYTGNGSTDGTFVYTGFKPSFVLIKSSSSAQSWNILDIKRDINPNAKVLWPNDNYAEYDETQGVDFLSNGFKNNESGAGFNGSGASYIYMAFAEAPLVGTNNVPCTAR